MQNITIQRLKQPELSDILNPGERLLWTGTPEYGRKLLQAVGYERTFHICVFVGVLFIWLTIPFIDDTGSRTRATAFWTFGGVTIVFLVLSFSLAEHRQFVLRNLAYFVTDKRVIICRRGRNWHFSDGTYVVSVPHAETYPYAVHLTRPFPSLLVGTLFSVDQVQPFGSGLAHAGHSPLRNRTASPITLDYISDAETVLDLIRDHAPRMNTSSRI